MRTAEEKLKALQDAIGDAFEKYSRGQGELIDAVRIIREALVDSKKE